MRGDNLNVQHGKDLTTKSIGTLYKNAFGNLPNRTPFHDPLGCMGPERSMKQTIFESQEAPIRKFFKAHNENNFSLYEAQDIVRKSLDDGDWTLPTYFLPEVQVLQPQLTPLAELMPRVSVENKDVKVQVVDEDGFPSVTWGLGGDVSSVQEWDYADASYSNYSYSVVGYDTGTMLEDFLVLQSQPLRNAVSVAETNLMHAMRIEEEAQLIQGKGTNTGTTNDASGWDGPTEHNTHTSTEDPSAWSDTQYKEKTRDLISKVEKHGGNKENMIIVTTFDVYNNLANALDDFTRYDVTGADELDFGFSTLSFENVPIMKSQGFASEIGSTTTDDPFMIAIDLQTNWMGALRDTTLQPVPKRGPQELVAVDAYTTSVSQAKKRIQWYGFS